MNLRPYAERLAKAMPERFVSDDYKWADDKMRPDMWIAEVASNVADWWAFFGPLASEFGVDWTNLPAAATFLEAVAEAVCRAAEAKAKEVGK